MPRPIELYFSKMLQSSTVSITEGLVPFLKPIKNTGWLHFVARADEPIWPLKSSNSEQNL